MTRRGRDHDAVGPRARSVLDVLTRLGEATGPRLMAELPDLASYSALRSILRALERKGLVQHRAENLKYVYRARLTKQSKEAISRRMLSRVLHTYFAGQPEPAIKALIDVSRDEARDVDYDALQRLIDDARKEGR